MLKHRGFPGRLPGTDYQFVIRRLNPKGVTPLTKRERYADRKPADRRADAAFLAALWEYTTVFKKACENDHKRKV